MAIRWIFFDVGSTLVDEDGAFRWRYDKLRGQIAEAAGRDIPYEEFEEMMHEAGKVSGAPFYRVLSDIGLKLYIEYRAELERPYPEAASVLKTLKRMGYNIGIIANQGVGLSKRLEAYGLSPWLDAVFGSDDLKLWKPDTAFYRYALEQTGCLPNEAVMVGDRIDNDVAPAHNAGMRAVRILCGYFDRRLPYCPEEEPDATAEDLSVLPDAISRLD